MKDGILLKLKNRRLPLFLATLIFSAVGFVLRYLELLRAYDAPGLPTAGSGLALALCILCALAVLLLLFGCGALPKRETFARSFPPCAVCFIVSLLAAAALLAGSAAGVWNAIPRGDEPLSVWTALPGFCGILGALCLFLAAVARFKGTQPITSLYLIPFFFAVVRLIVDFKGGWSSDPAILDYCFDLFAMLAAMSALYHLAGFCFDRGRRARTTFWCLTGVVFLVVSMAGAGLADRLTYGGLALWLLASAWQLLSPGSPEPEDAPEDSPR